MEQLSLTLKIWIRNVIYHGLQDLTKILLSASVLIPIFNKIGVKLLPLGQEIIKMS